MERINRIIYRLAKRTVCSICLPICIRIVLKSAILVASGKNGTALLILFYKIIISCESEYIENGRMSPPPLLVSSPTFTFPFVAKLKIFQIFASCSWVFFQNRKMGQRNFSGWFIVPKKATKWSAFSTYFYSQPFVGQVVPIWHIKRQRSGDARIVPDRKVQAEKNWKIKKKFIIY